jgi:hypothetical protein
MDIKIQIFQQDNIITQFGNGSNDWENNPLFNDKGIPQNTPVTAANYLVIFTIRDITNFSYLTSFAGAFVNAINLVIMFSSTGKNVVTSNMNDTSYKYFNCSKFNKKISTDATNITDMSYMFYGATNFNNGYAMGENSGTIFVNPPEDGLLEKTKYMFYNATNYNGYIKDWDVSNISDTSYMFYGASNFNNGYATGHNSEAVFSIPPNDGKLYYTNYMFNNATNFNGYITDWNVTNTLDMSYMFYGATSFNNGIQNNITVLKTKATRNAELRTYKLYVPPYLYNPPPQNLISTERQFQDSPDFNWNISNWDMSAVTSISGMFSGATKFNNGYPAGVSNILFDTNNGGKPPTSILEQARVAFQAASSFNGIINNWNTTRLYDMYFMFANASLFNNGHAANENSGNLFNSVTAANVNSNEQVNITAIFQNATNFNGEVNNWKTTNVIDMTDIFNNAQNFNGALNNWDTSSVLTMFESFAGATSFNQSLSSWLLQSISAEQGGLLNMLDNTAMSIVNYDATLNSWANNVNTPNGLSLGAQGLYYDEIGLIGRNKLISVTGYNWTITGDRMIIYSNICFKEDTFIQTDQGKIPIQKIDCKYHTINNEKIIAITRTIPLSPFLICIEKDALGENQPTQNTIMSKEHKLLVNGRMIKASLLLNKVGRVYKVPCSDNKPLYNVLMENYRGVNVNGLICETLNPNNMVAKMYLNETNYNNNQVVKMNNIMRNMYILKGGRHSRM